VPLPIIAGSNYRCRPFDALEPTGPDPLVLGASLNCSENTNRGLRRRIALKPALERSQRLACAVRFFCINQRHSTPRGCHPMPARVKGAVASRLCRSMRESGGGSRLRESKIDSQARSNESTEARLFLLVVSAKLNLLLLLCWRLPCRRGWGQQLMSALKSFNLI
jgi:hypothetical protein